MRRLRLTLKALIPVLILTAIFFGSCTEDDSPDIPSNNNTGGGNDEQVSDFESSISSLMIDDYFGKTDTLSIQVKAIDDDGLAVKDAKVVISVAKGPGFIYHPNGDLTDETGIVNSKYIHSVTKNDTAEIDIKIGTVTKPAKTVIIKSNDVHVTMTATPDEVEVDQGAAATSTLKIRVRDDMGVNVVGVPIRVQLLSEEGTLSPPIPDVTDNTFTSSLSVDAVEESMECQVRAFIDVDLPIDPPTGDSVRPTDGKKSKSGRYTAESTINDTVTVNFIPLSSQVDHISVMINPNQIIAGAGVSEEATVEAIAADENNNGISGLNLSFKLRNLEEGQSAGTVSIPPVTDEFGKTTATISTDGKFGDWALEVRTSEGNQNFWADTLHILTGEAQNLTVKADTNRVSVWGTNGEETTTIRAKVKDQNNQPVQDGKMVFFLAQSYPHDILDEVFLKINDSDVHVENPYVDPRFPQLYLPFDSSATNNGEAFVALTAGEAKGIVDLKVWTFADEERTERIESTYSGLKIASGPPHFIEVDYNPTGHEQGSSIWDMEISARVQDSMNNDVEDGYAVLFSVVPELAHAHEIGYTGNESLHSTESTAGVAYSILSYHSRNTNQEVTVNAMINRITGQQIQSSVTLNLPIQSASGVMTVSPLNWDYGENGDDPAILELRLEVRDGYGRLINDQLVQFGSSKGRIFTNDVYIPSLDPEYFALTGPADVSGTPDDDPEGVSIRYFIATKDEAFPDPNVPEAAIQIFAEIIGAPDANVEPVTIYVIN